MQRIFVGWGKKSMEGSSISSKRKILGARAALEQDVWCPGKFWSQHRSMGSRPTLSLTGLGSSDMFWLMLFSCKICSSKFICCSGELRYFFWAMNKSLSNISIDDFSTSTVISAMTVVLWSGIMITVLILYYWSIAFVTVSFTWMNSKVVVPRPWYF